MKLTIRMGFGLLAFLAGTLSLPLPLSAGEPAKELLKATGKLTDDDPNDKLLKKGKAKVHTFKMEAGKGYRIELRSDDFDAFLRLENSDGKHLAADDDSGGVLNARLIHQADKDGIYNIVVTSFDGKMGQYTLTVTAASKSDLLEARAAKFSKLPAAEQAQVLTDLKKYFGDKGKNLNSGDLKLAMGLAINLEFKDKDKALEVYKDFFNMFVASSDEKVISDLKKMDGAIRRLGLVGKTMAIKGKTLDGKDFDWAKYKGKVVLVDFWATWCGPCIAELPNVKKMYETYHDRGFEVVGISTDQQQAKPIKFMEDRKLPWTCLWDERKEGCLSEQYGVFFIPLAILVDRDGKVVSLNARGPELPRLLEKLIGADKEKK